MTLEEVEKERMRGRGNGIITATVSNGVMCYALETPEHCLKWRDPELDDLCWRLERLDIGYGHTASAEKNWLIRAHETFRRTWKTWDWIEYQAEVARAKAILATKDSEHSREMASEMKMQLYATIANDRRVTRLANDGSDVYAKEAKKRGL